MRRIAAVLLFLAIVAGAFAGILRYSEIRRKEKQKPPPQAEIVRVYTDFQTEILEQTAPLFYADTGIQMDIFHVTTEELLNETAENEEPADVIVTSQNTLLKLKTAHRLSAYSSAETDMVPDIFKDRDGHWTGLWVDPIVFAVSGDYVKTHPAAVYNWTEVFLRQDVRLVMTDFIAASMAGDFFMSLAEHFGINETFMLLSGAQGHTVQYGKYLSTPARIAGMGKCDVGISGLNEAVRAQKEGLPVKILYPLDGSPWYLYGMALATGGKAPERGKKLIDWLMYEPKYAKAMRDANYFYVSAAGHAPKDEAGVEIAYWPLEKKYFEEGKKALLNEWAEKIRFGGKK